MKLAREFAPGRLVLATGERVRTDPDGAAGVLLNDFDVLTRAEAYEADLAVLRLAVRHIQDDPNALPSDDMAKRRSGPSGKPWTEEQYREAGIETLHLRLGADDHGALDELALAWGYEGRGARGLAVKRAIAEAHARVVPQARRTQLVEQPPDESAIVTREPLNARARRRKSDK